MKIVLAPDKFKNSLTGLQFCNAVIDGIHSVCTDIDILKLPLADGGDGTIEVVNYYLKGVNITLIKFFNIRYRRKKYIFSQYNSIII